MLFRFSQFHSHYFNLNNYVNPYFYSNHSNQWGRGLSYGRRMRQISGLASPGYDGSSLDGTIDGLGFGRNRGVWTLWN